jgi:hypothetical protein
MANVNLIKWLTKNKRVDGILKQGYEDYNKQRTFGRKIKYKDWKRRSLVWILFYLSEIESLLSFIGELNKKAAYRRKLGFRNRIGYKSIWNFRKCVKIDVFNKIIILCVHLLQKRGIVGKNLVIDGVIIDSYANTLKGKDKDAKWGYSCKGFTFGYKMLALIDLNSSLIIGFIALPASVHDVKKAKELITKYCDEIGIENIIGDKGFDSMHFRSFIIQRGMGAAIMFRKNRKMDEQQVTLNSDFCKGKYVYMMEILTGLSKREFHSLTKRRKEAELGFARGKAYFHLNSFRSFGIINAAKHFALSILSQLIYALYYFKGRIRAINRPSVFL